jgi:hypothetical protein
MIFDFGLFAIVVFGVCWAFNVLEYDAEDKTKGAALLRNLRLATIIVVISGFINCFFPNQKAVYTIAGAYAVTNNEELAKLPNNVIKAANDYLEKLNDAKTK